MCHRAAMVSTGPRRGVGAYIYGDADTALANLGGSHFVVLLVQSREAASSERKTFQGQDTAIVHCAIVSAPTTTRLPRGADVWRSPTTCGHRGWRSLARTFRVLHGLLIFRNAPASFPLLLLPHYVPPCPRRLCSDLHTAAPRHIDTFALLALAFITTLPART